MGALCTISWQLGANSADLRKMCFALKSHAASSVAAQSGLFNETMFFADIQRAARSEEHRKALIAFVLIIDLRAKMKYPA
jgi:hypothetical protein